MQIRWLWREQWPFKVSKIISVRMRDLLWRGVQPIMVRGGVQPTTTTTTTSRSRWHGGVGKLNFQPYSKGRSGTGEKETHSINVVGKITTTKTVIIIPQSTYAVRGSSLH